MAINSTKTQVNRDWIKQRAVHKVRLQKTKELIRTEERWRVHHEHRLIILELETEGKQTHHLKPIRNTNIIMIAINLYIMINHHSNQKYRQYQQNQEQVLYALQYVREINKRN